MKASIEVYCLMSWRPDVGIQEWAGLVPRGLSASMWTAVLPLCPHVIIPLCMSASSSALLIRMVVRQSHGFKAPAK